MRTGSDIIQTIKLNKNILTTDKLVERMVKDHKYYKISNINRVEKAKSYEKDKNYVPEN